MEDGLAEVAETFCRVESSKGWDVDGACVSGRFWGGVGCSDYGRGLLEEACAKFGWEVGWDVGV